MSLSGCRSDGPREYTMVASICGPCPVQAYLLVLAYHLGTTCLGIPAQLLCIQCSKPLLPLLPLKLIWPSFENRGRRTVF